MLRHFAAILVLASCACAADDTPWFSFRWSGGHSPYQSVAVSILSSGDTTVTVQKQNAAAFDYHTTLSPEEQAALVVLVKAAAFFDLPDQDLLLMKDGGKTELTVTRDSQTRTLTFLHRPELEPISQYCWRLVTQACAIRDLEQDGDVYTATGTVKPTHAGLKALQPSRLKDPLMGYVKSRNDRQKIEWALEALSFLTTPEEFCGLVSLGLTDESRRPVMLSIIASHPFYGNIPKSHLDALRPIYLVFVRDSYHRKDQLPDTEKQFLLPCINLLGDTRYQPAIAVFKGWFEEHNKLYATADLMSLAKMGMPSLDVLTPYLDSTNAAYRVNAVELLTIASRLGPRAGFSNPLPESEYRRMIPVFTNTVIPKLLNLSSNDPMPKVRTKALEAVTEIRKHAAE